MRNIKGSRHRATSGFFQMFFSKAPRPGVGELLSVYSVVVSLLANKLARLTADLRHGAAVGACDPRLAHFEVDVGFLAHQGGDARADIS